MKIIDSKDFDSYWKTQTAAEDTCGELSAAENSVKEIIAAVRKEGDAAVRRFASKFDRSSPQKLEVPLSHVQKAYEDLRANDCELTAALELAAQNIYRFSLKQKEQFADFETEIQLGVFTGQRVIPVQRAAIYVPGGRFPLFSSALMGLIPAFCAGAEEVIFASPPAEDGLPDKKILAAAAISYSAAFSNSQSFGSNAGQKLPENGKLRVFAIGGAQAIAALAFGTESVPRADVIAGPGNKYVAAAKRLLYGQVGIDFIAGPSDVLVINDGAAAESTERAADFAAADMIAQAEHDPDARARALVPDRELADKIAAAVEKRLSALKNVPAAGYASAGYDAARASLENGGLIVIYQNREEAIRIANTIAPEHLELHLKEPQDWIQQLKNYGSLFIGALSAEVLGDYSAGINHTLPTSASARFTGGLSVRNFLKTVTTLRCTHGDGFEKVRGAAQIIAKAEGLEGHALSADARSSLKI